MTTKIMRSESEIQRQILDWLKIKDIYAWRNNTGAMSGSHKGKRWFVRFGCAGMSDILGLLNTGKFLAIEVKRPGGKLTPAQEGYLAAIRARQGVAIVARSLEDVTAILG